jgi:tetratricopeptide (TPR) repeat protein
VRIKKFILPAALLAAIVVVLVFRTGPRNSEPPIQGKETAESPSAPSKENVSSSFLEHVELLKKKAAAHPRDVQTLKTLAQWLMDAHKTEEAIIYFERGVALQPKNDSLLLDLSVCYFQLNRYDKAMRATDQILNYYPDHPRALLNKGVIYAAQNRSDDAVKTWSRLVKRSPETDEAQQAKQYLAQLRRQ